MFNDGYSDLYNFGMSERFDWFTGEKVSTGRIFHNRIQTENLSDVRIIHQGIDTLKQRYHGTVKRSFAQSLLNSLEGSFDPVFHLNGVDFIARPSSKASGYKFMVHSKALGLIIFVGDYFRNDETWLDEGAGKVKFELSPHLILSSGVENCMYLVNDFIRCILDDFVPVSCDVHLCVDVQGWRPTQDLIRNMKTMTRKKVSYSGIDELNFDFHTSAIQYGADDSFLFGRASSSQLAVYNKTKESVVTGKSDFWRSVYDAETVLFNEDDDVYRIELRLPGNVLKNLVKKDDGEPHLINDIESLVEHLNSLWRYGLSRLFRYDYEMNTKKETIINPFWQLLLQDVYFNEHLLPVDYKRDYLSTDISIDHNLKLLIGNFTTACAKASKSDDETIQALKSMPFYRQILEYAFEKKNLSESNYLAHILDVLHKKRIEYDERAALSQLDFQKMRRNYKVYDRAS